MNNVFHGRAALGGFTLAALALLLALAGLAAASGAETAPTKWTIDGVEREALIFPPTAKEPSGKAPLVFVFHGHGGSMETAAKMSFQKVWPGALVVCMQGLPSPSTYDPEGRQPGWQLAPGQNGDRDFKFFDAVLKSVSEKYAVNRRRIYAAGFSNGAMFTFLLWEKRGEIFAAYGVCAGQIVPPGATLGPPRPVIQIAGEKDEVVSYQSQLQTLAAIRQHNGCAAEGQPWGEHCTIYPSAKGAPLVTYIHPGGHIYAPGTTTLMARFFGQHALGEGAEGGN